MLPERQQEKWRKMMTMRSTSTTPSLSAESFDEIPTLNQHHRYQNYQQCFDSPIGPPTSPIFHNFLDFQNNIHFNSELMGYSDRKIFASPPTPNYSMQQEMAVKQLMFMRNMALNFPNLLTPAATESNSRCTLSSEFSHASSRDEYEKLMRDAHLSSEDLGRKENKKLIFTAESVHNLVKSLRDNNKRRLVSNKVFVGGINHSMDRKTIDNFFYQFGEAFIDWPVKVPKINARGKQMPASSYSYLFLVYAHEESVLKLVKECHSPSFNEYYVHLPECRDVIQIRPWFLENAFFIHPTAMNRKVIDVHRTVFVGGLPRIVTATEIAQLFSEFGKVLLVTIDIDQDYGYPKGAARVTFEKDSSLSMALDKQYLKFDNIDSSKTTIEIKPYVMEDVGCDQCGGLWFNPFVDILSHLESSWDQRNDSLNIRKEEKLKMFNDWSTFDGPNFNASNVCDESSEQSFDLHKSGSFGSVGSEKKSSIQSINRNLTLDSDEDELRAGSQQFFEAVKRFNLHTQKTVKLGNNEVPIGPDLWGYFIVQPQMDLNTSPHQLDQQIESHLKMKPGNVYSNKSSYCKDKPCRQYYCASCSHKLHSRIGMKQHILLPAGKPERRPRKDKDMYLVRKQF